MPLYRGSTKIGELYIGSTKIGEGWMWDGTQWVQVYSSITFTPTGMTKSGSQAFSTTAVQVTGFSADTGTYPGSVVTGGSTLVVQGGKVGATIAASVVGDGSSPSRQFLASLRLNGSEIASATGGNQSTLTPSTTADVADGDEITLWVQRTTGSGNASVGSGTWVRCT